MYFLVHPLGSRNTPQLISQHKTMREAASARLVSGDVVYEGTSVGDMRICKSTDWLWDWEKKDINCFAQKQIRKG